MSEYGYPNSTLQAVSDLGRKQKYPAIESFCGAGGISLGLKWAGFDVRFAFDADEAAVATHNQNLDSPCVAEDVRKLSGKDAIREAKVSGEIALFAGGPPCQGFSKQRRGGHLGDERNDLVLEYVRLVSEIQPRFFLFENVAIFGQKRGEIYVREMHRRLSEYVLTPHFYNSADFGLPQTRQRFVIVGKRRDQKTSFTIPEPTVKKWRTVGEVLAGLPPPPLDFSVHPDYPNHVRANITELNIRRFSHVPQGGGWQSIPNSLRLDCHKDLDTTQGGWPDVYGRLEWDGQCPTITGGFDSFTRGRYGHPLEDRAITPREAARIQGFPDDYAFCGTRGDVRKQIGNAVPPSLAEAIGLQIMRTLLCSDGLMEDSLQNGATLGQLELNVV